MKDKTRLSIFSLSICLALIIGCSRGTPSPITPTTPVDPETGVSRQSKDDPVLDAEIIIGWEFAKAGKTLNWVPTHDLRLFSVDDQGLNTASTGGDPYMVGPSIKIDAASAPYAVVRMRSTKGAGAQLFWEVDGAAFNEPCSMHFAVKTDNNWHTYVVPLRNNANWAGKITRIRLDPSNNSGAEINIAYIRLVGPFPARLEARSVGPANAIVPENTPFQVSATVVNTGDMALDTEQITLKYSGNLVLVEGVYQTEISALAPGEAITLTWTLQGNPGAYQLFLESSDRFLQQGAVVIESTKVGQLLVLENSNIRLTFSEQPFGYGIATLDWFDGTNWRTAGRMRSLGEIRYLDANLSHHRVPIYAQKGILDEGRLSFTSTYTDKDGATWTLTASFTLGPADSWIGTHYQLQTNKPVKLTAWTGPEYLAGEGSFAEARDSGLFPGLEYLLADEKSSGTDFADAPAAIRYVPHPNKITIPLMAVTTDGMTTGLMWDPVAPWDQEHDRPAALFASPNSWEGEDNHLMRLFVPGITAGLEENADELEGFYSLAANTTLTLEADLFAAAASDPLVPIDLWLFRNGLPELPQAPYDYKQATQLCLDAYLKTTYDPATKGWHLALPDPWGPSPSAANALHLEIAALNSADAAQAEMLQGISRASTSALGMNGGINPWQYQPVLSMLRADDTRGITDSFMNALTIIQSQTSSGAWGFTPQQRTGRAFGQFGDTSSGYVATKAFPVLYAARLTGNASLIESGLKALDFLTQLELRPEGAQTWELQLHVPDLLGAAWTSQAFVEGYLLTGNTQYLDSAQRWAISGLPFIYLWNAPDRKIMRYTTVPVFGASNYNYPWFGRPVMWNGLDYAIGLQALAAALEQAQIEPLTDWRQLAEGITIATLQMQATEGPFQGMYPDAWDVVAGDEAYSWWLIPTYILQNILLIQNNPQAQITTKIVSVNEAALRISSVIPEMTVRGDNQSVTIELPAIPGEATVVLLSPVTQLPGAVTINGTQIPVNLGWLDPLGAWQYSMQSLKIRVPNTGSPSKIVVVFRN